MTHADTPTVEMPAVLVEGKPHCPRCGVAVVGIVDYGVDGDRFWFVVVCPRCSQRVRYTRPIRKL